jgi:hypothetical protein
LASLFCWRWFALLVAVLCADGLCILLVIVFVFLWLYSKVCIPCGSVFFLLVLVGSLFLQACPVQLYLRLAGFLWLVCSF